IVYVAPMKALAAEMTNYFSKRLEPLGITVKELTGDMQLTKGEILRTQTNRMRCSFQELEWACEPGFLPLPLHDLEPHPDDSWYHRRAFCSLRSSGELCC
ncbi:hypothetical protein ILYODFUR_017045, partial [Ilyodon furcidens]